MSKYIPKSRAQHTTIDIEWSNATWSSKTNKKEQEETEEYYNNLAKEKERIENIPLEELTFRDLYKFPFRQAKYVSWVYDKNSNFIFQFEFSNKETREKCIQILNEELLYYKKQEVEAKNGEIFVNGEHFITIRGWGNLTGVGSYNLDGKYAAKIQDTLEQYIVEKLCKR